MKKITKIHYLIVGVLLLSSCSKDRNLPEEKPKNTTTKSCQCNVEEAFPDVEGEPIIFGTKGNSISLVKKGEHFILDGDILLTPDQAASIKSDFEQKEKTKAAFIKNKTWSGGIIPFVIDPSLPNQFRVWEAIQYWTNNTVIQFVPRTTQANYVRFVPSTSCASGIGMTGGEQLIYLANECTRGNAMHEIGHTAGLFHEHTRNDRGDYIDIHPENIISGKEYNFNYYRVSYSGYEIGDFDFNSIMLYGSTAFSKNNQATITRKNGSTFEGQRDSLSHKDIEGINFLYLGNPNGQPFARIEVVNIGQTTSQPNIFFQDYADYYIAFYTTYQYLTPIIPSPSINFKYKSELTYVNYFSTGLLNGGSPISGSIQNTNGLSKIFLGRHPYSGSQEMDDPQYGQFTENYLNNFRVETGPGYNIYYYY